MTLHRLGAFMLCGLVAASHARGETIDYQALDDRSKVAVAESCDSWVLREGADLIAFWMTDIEPLCAAASTPSATGQAPVAPAQGQ